MFKAILRKNILLLMGCQVISISGTVTMVTLGGILGAVLAEHRALATLPMSLMILGTAATTIPASMFMARVGRRFGFMVGAGLAVGAMCLAAVAVWLSSFELLCFAALVLGSKLAFSAQYRFGAAESAPASAAGLAISMVLAGSLIGALIGPTIAIEARYWVAGVEHFGTFLLLAVLFVGEIALLAGLKFAPVRDRNVAAPEPPSVREIVRNRTFLVAVLGGVVGQGTMTFIMTATPLSMHVIDGLSLTDTALVIQSHVIAMYAPSLVSGFIVMRLGAARMMAIGVLVTGLTVGVGLVGHQFLHYWAALSLLGIGWNFLFVGATTLLVGATRNEERFKAQAINEFSVFGMSALASLSAGTVMHFLGWSSILIATVPLLVLMLISLAMLPRKTIAAASA